MNIDDTIANNEYLLSLFKNIHPNIITITGIITNFFIPYFIFRNNINVANIILVIRYFTDIFDGSVARKYNKTSKLGSILDTINDNILITIYGYLFGIKFYNKYAKIIGFILMILHLYYMKQHNGFLNHNNIKSGAKNSFLKIIQFFTNNSIFIFIGLFYFNLNF